MMLVFLGLICVVLALCVSGLLFDGLHTLWARRWSERLRRTARTPLKLVVIARENHAADMFGIVLARPDGKRLPAFLPGQFLTVRAPAGADGRMSSRRYSLSAWTPRPREYQLGIRRVAGGCVSNWLYTHALTGVEIEILPPAGEFVLQSGKGEVVLVGAGIGITPMAAMVDALAARPGLAGRVWLFHSARTQDELVGCQRFAELENTASWFRYRPCLTRPGPGWTAGTGRLAARDLVRELADPATAAFYFCARQEMMDDLAAGLAALGVPATALHRESFGGAQANADSAEYRVSVEGYGGHAFLGQPSLLHALEEWGVPVKAECRAGECGACRLRLRQGTVRNRLQATDRLADGEFFACCAVPASDLDIAMPAPGG